MTKKKIRCISMMVAQHRDGAEIEVIEDAGVLYLPMYQALNGGDSEDVPAKKASAEKAAPAASKSKGKAAPAEEAQPESDASDSEAARTAVDDLLVKMDAGKMSKEKVLTKIAALTGLTEEEVDAEIEKMIDDDQIEISEITDALFAPKVKAAKARASSKVAAPEKPEKAEKAEKAEKPATKGAAPKAAAKAAKPKKLPKSADGEDAPEGDVVSDWATLKAGDVVSVYWGTDPETEEVHEDWFPGTVSSNKRGKVHIDYDDETDGDLVEGLCEFVVITE